MIDEPTPFDQTTLSRRLSPRPVRFFAQIGSTNDSARDWLLNGGPSGAVVIADEQTKGRGRKGRAWSTPPGTAIAASVLLHPRPAGLSQVTMLGGLAVAQMLDSFGLTDARIKWPNDVLIHGRKVCGVLSEAVWEGERLRGAVLGIGINVRVDFTGSPLADIATSIAAETGRAIDRAEVLAVLLERVDHWAALLDTNALFERWRDRLGMLGRTVQITQEHSTLTGIAEDVTRSGTLLLRDATGSLHRVIAGDVSMGE